MSESSTAMSRRTGLITRQRKFDAEGKCSKGHTRFARANTAADVRAIVRDAIKKCDQGLEP